MAHFQPEWLSSDTVLKNNKDESHQRWNWLSKVYFWGQWKADFPITKFWKPLPWVLLCFIEKSSSTGLEFGSPRWSSESAEVRSGWTSNLQESEFWAGSGLLCLSLVGVLLCSWISVGRMWSLLWYFAQWLRAWAGATDTPRCGLSSGTYQLYEMGQITWHPGKSGA